MRRLAGKDVVAPNGICRWCKKPVVPPRRSWCGQRCINEYLVRSDQSWARGTVLARDQGICALCGLDCYEMERAIRERLKVWQRQPWTAISSTWPPPDVVEVMAPLGFTRQGMRAGHLWEMDHVLPVAEGGGSCGLSNLRTLCLPCHREQTTALAGRLARKRRGS